MFSILFFPISLLIANWNKRKAKVRPDSSNTPLIITEQWKRIQLAVLFAKYWNIIWSLKWWIIKWDQEKMVAAWSWRRIMFLLEFPFSFFSFLCFGLSGFPLVLVHKRKEKKRSLKLRYIICKLFCGLSPMIIFHGLSHCGWLKFSLSGCFDAFKAFLGL